MLRKAAFLVGLFLLCACVLILQIVETRLLSVISFYHLAFFAISMAMFGMTAGALIVYFNQAFFSPERLLAHLSWIAAAFAMTAILSTVVLISTVVLGPPMGIILLATLWLKLIAALVPPYVFAGMGISLALTRSPWPIGLVYGFDLAGAALGCLGALALMSTLDGVSVMLMVGALGASAAFAFALGCRETEWQALVLPRLARLLRRPGMLAVALLVLALGNAAIYPHGLVLSFAKARVETTDVIEHTQWNSYSRIRAEKIVHGSPAMWGGSSAMPPIKIDQRYMNIDGDAGTTMFRFGGDLAEVDFLKYDVTSLAYYIRNRGRAAVIGVGGGRDLLAARLFGFRDVTGIELNPIFIDYLTRRFRDFNRLADLPGVRFEIDEARSWFANAGRDQNFDLVQMSMIDTWAATAVGAYSLSENGLYTVEGWRQFLASLAPDGVFTVSRWYSPDDVDETGRLLSLAKATLLDMGVPEPQNHLLLASSGRLSTLIVGRAPLSRQDVALLRETTTRLGFSILVGPDLPAASPALKAIMNAPDAAALTALSATLHQDVSAPTDDRPFFFNQLRMTDPQAVLRAMQVRSGVISGNLDATIALLIIVLLSLILVVLTIILPALPSIQRVSARLIGLGTAYFVLIGLGFMLVEIGLIQRLSLFLGHPIHGLAVGLFAVILSTGIGSIVSDRLPITKTRHAVLWCGVLTTYLALLPFGLPLLVASFEAYRILVRAVAAVLVVAPLGLLLGFGFPTGMRLVNAIDPRPTPWFWAINGAAGVLAASIAVAVNIAFSINVSIWLGAACYGLIGVAAIALISLSPRASPTIPGAA
ncbi:MAG: hypothetical protein ACJ8D4_05355 [Xanthobacteraceae bacterium]